MPSPVGLIALGVAPVGALHGNTEAPASTSAQVAFSIPSQQSPLLPTNQALTQLVTNYPLIGEENPTEIEGPVARVPAGEREGPEVIFDEALVPPHQVRAGAGRG
jgi:hypothetical protein